MASATHDVVTLGWAAITVRVAWTLRSEGVRITRDRLRDAREHVLWHLPRELAIHRAEDLAERLVRAWVARAEGRPWRPRFPEDDDHALPQRWRDAMFAGVPGIARAVLWKHYADGLALHRLSERYPDTDRLAWEAAREGLREAVREVARNDGRPVDGWADDRLDDLLHRLAQVPMQPAPSLLDVVDGQQEDAVRRCVRCARAWTLVTDGYLARADLVAPSVRARPTGMMSMVAVQLRREIRHRRSRLQALLPSSFPLGEDVLLVHAPDPRSVFEVLAERARTSWPERDRIRGVVLTVEGRWSSAGPLGPGPNQVEPALRRVRWGHVDGLGELPPPLPSPPSAWPAWAWAAVLVAAAVLVGQQALRPPPAPGLAQPLVVEAVSARQGVWVEFDVDDRAPVLVVQHSPDGLEVLLDGRSATGKARVATGDGRYRLHALGSEVLVARPSRPLLELPGVIAGARDEEAPLEVVARALRSLDPGADVRIVP